MEAATLIQQIQQHTGASTSAIAHLLDASLASVDRWRRGMAQPSPAQLERIQEMHRSMVQATAVARPASPRRTFAARGARKPLPLFAALQPQVHLTDTPLPPIIERLRDGTLFKTAGQTHLAALLTSHAHAAPTASTPPTGGMSAGKNTYTYDAHTYHTKVPPQGIAELLAHYLPQGGLILDPFAGSGMTGVAARVSGIDCILNELSPAACFIANQFNAVIDPDLFEAGLQAILAATESVRAALYTTQCRECGKPTEIQYTVWSYLVVCPHCAEQFPLWDHCRQYGETVKDHKILSEFPCPCCNQTLKKSLLQRASAVPVLIGYKCCGSKQQEVTHPPTDSDRAVIASLAYSAPYAEGYYPRTQLYEGVNLRQPIKHGLDRVDKFYTPRNLAAMSQLWRAIHRVEDRDAAAFLAFTFTSLYQRVTRMSEFRFWGGSGNTARFNVPYIFNEANVFLTFIRKARSIHDHLQTTAQIYRGCTQVIHGSATNLHYLPDESIDLVFTDPPFGGNINYSEMNILWESWLGVYTDTKNEAIVNKFQGKGIEQYQQLMSRSIAECYRVLRSGGWMLLMFMNSSKDVWNALQNAILGAGFSIEKIDMFDKQHGTFKQFVSENTAGFDLVLHCRKPQSPGQSIAFDTLAASDQHASIRQFIAAKGNLLPTNTYLHVSREDEIDYRQLYSEWLSQSLISTADLVDFAEFRKVVQEYLSPPGYH